MNTYDGLIYSILVQGKIECCFRKMDWILIQQIDFNTKAVNKVAVTWFRKSRNIGRASTGYPGSEGAPWSTCRVHKAVVGAAWCRSGKCLFYRSRPCLQKVIIGRWPNGLWPNPDQGMDDCSRSESALSSRSRSNELSCNKNKDRSAPPKKKVIVRSQIHIEVARDQNASQCYRGLSQTYSENVLLYGRLHDESTECRSN